MSKKRKKKKQKSEERKVLDKMLDCNTNCADLGSFDPVECDDRLGQIEYYLEALPMIGYVRNQLVNYIFSNGMTAGGIEEDEKLHSFLYRTNERNETNYSVLRDAVGSASVYGECGVHWHEGNIYTAKTGTYAPVTWMNNGVEEVTGYLLSTKGEDITRKKIELPEDGSLRDILMRLSEQDLMLLDTSDFVNVRNDTSTLYGDSPLLRERLRLELLVTAYERLNYDLKYDGPGRILLRPKDGITSEDNDISTSTIMNQTMSAGKTRNQKAQEEVERVGRAIKESKSDSVILLSNAFSDKVEHLERVTKATEFLNWINKEGEIVASVMGLPPSLLEQGDLSGNVSMTRIIDNAMTNSIIPQREHYATQLSPMLSWHLGVQKVYFAKYTLQSEDSEEQKRLKVTTAIQQLAYSLEKYDSDDVRKVIDSMAEMLDYNLHDSVGGIVEL